MRSPSLRFSVIGKVLLGILVSVGLGGCASSTPAPPVEDPLVGVLYDTRARATLDYAELIERASGAEVLYLGEIHDNAEHHERQVRVIESLVERGLKPAIGFEFFDVGETGLLTQYVQGSGALMKLKSASKRSAEARLRKALGWQDRDDRDWQFYFRLIELARKHKLTVFGSDLPQGIKTRISRDGLAGLNPVERSLLVDSGFQDETYRKLMYRQFTRAHCGWGDPAMLKRLYQTWVARNDRMATSIVAMLQGSEARPVVLIVGNGHVRHDMGVYERVASLRPDTRQLNLGLREVSGQPEPPAYYLEPTQMDERTFLPDHQILWFSRHREGEDICARFTKPH